MADVETLTELTAGQAIPFGGDRVTRVGPDLAAAFRPGDRLIVVEADGTLLHIDGPSARIAADAVDRAAEAFAGMGAVSDAAVSAFFLAFAERLADAGSFGAIAAANAADVEAARAAGRSTTRLVLSESMRDDMIDGLRGWAAAPSGRGERVVRVEHPGWSVELLRAGLGVVGFVFEGRPNVFADACGVIRSGNTVVFRIGSDALGTARAIVEHALDPALRLVGLPAGAASLVDSPSRATGWAMFADNRLSLAVARGSGSAVTQLGAVARQAGVAVSLHGTGGAWMVGTAAADVATFSAAVRHSLDRKVCNTLNVCCVTRDAADTLVPAFLAALRDATTARGTNPKLHVLAGGQALVPDSWFAPTEITRAAGTVTEPGAEILDETALGVEWEWEDSPEVTLAIVDGLDHAVSLCNRHSPRFVASLISEDSGEQQRFFDSVDAPFVGNGFTRWVDGQYALGTPELGLSNWQFGRLFGRGGVLSGDSVFTVRTRATQTDPDVHR